jgi:hypothetical protein
MNKVIRDGKVAVLYTVGYSSGWFTWGAPIELVFDPEIVALVEAGEHKKIKEILKHRGFDPYSLYYEQLGIVWIPVGTEFMIEKHHNGGETIKLNIPEPILPWLIA